MRKALLSFTCALALAACNKPVTEMETIPHEDPDIPIPVSLKLTPSIVELGFEGGSDTTLIVTEVSTVDVSVSGEASSWLTVSVEDGVLTVTVSEENPDNTSRTGIVTVIAGEGTRASSAELSVVQAGTPLPVLVLEAASATLEAADSSVVTISISQTNQTNLAVSAPGCDWLKAEIEGDKLKITALSENSSSEIRQTTLTVSSAKISVEVTVSQSAAKDVNKVGTAYGKDGIYFWRNPDNPKQYKVVSAKAEKRAWGPQVVAGCPGTTISDSEVACANIRKLAQYKTDSFALQFCDGLGGGWHLPNYAEAENLFEAYNGLRFDNKKGSATQNTPANLTKAEKDARAAFDKVMTSIGGVLLNTAASTENGDSFWLCSENTAGTNAFYFRVGWPGYTHGAKTSTARFARCIKVVNE